MRYLSILLLGIYCLAPSKGIGQSYLANQWADSVLTTMSLDEKIGQLFVVATFSNQSEASYISIESMVRNQNLGGLIFMQGTPDKQVQLVNRYQKASKIPLLISQDAEWGLSMRLKSSPQYPRNLTLGAIQNDSLLYLFGRQIGWELQRVGVKMNFAPVVDINNNPKNPVINYRSFGENKYNVARKGIMVMQGMQQAGVMACAKHFPGHGDTDADSHFSLPVLNHSQERLDSLELYPFVKLAQKGVGAMMVGHLYIPSLDPTPNQATTLSPYVVHDLLRKRMRYNGLIITDALNMHGVSKYYSPGEVALKAFQAGNDILLFPQDIPRSAFTIKQALRKGTIKKDDLNQRVRRILIAKYKLGLSTWRPLPERGVMASLHSPQSQVLKEKLYEASMTLVKNDGMLVPIRKLDKRKIAYVQIGGKKGNVFFQTLAKYGDLDPFFLRTNFTTREQNLLIERLRNYDTIILGVFGMSSSASRNYGISLGTPSLCRQLAQMEKETVLTLFGSPYALKDFGPESAILVAYEGVEEAQEAAGEAIFGGIAVTGRLPVTGSDAFPEGTGVLIRTPIRFGFAEPEAQGLYSPTLNKIDSMANHYINKKAMPGCQILVLKGKDIVYEKGFGHLEFNTQTGEIHPYLHTYDLASVTKVAATTVSIMYLAERGLLDLDAPISQYLPEFKGTNKSKITVRQILQHNAGLPGWLSVYQETFINRSKTQLNRKYYSFYPTRSHQNQIAPALYASPELEKLFQEKLIQAQVFRNQGVRYSDVGLILAGKVIEKVSRRPLDEAASYIYYDRLGMNHTYFNPHKLGKEKYCPPTEADVKWRQAVIRGFVHDQNAAIMGGIAGHAGLFSNVYDLTKLMYMLKEGGMYGGERFLKPETIESFTKQQLRYNRKGLGWDKPEINGQRGNPCSIYSSKNTFGHTGFTGTAVWVDPDHDLIFVFLSNRTFPNPSNRKLLHEHVRSKIMDQVYKSMFDFERKYSRRYQP